MNPLLLPKGQWSESAQQTVRWDSEGFEGVKWVLPRLRAQCWSALSDAVGGGRGRRSEQSSWAFLLSISRQRVPEQFPLLCFSEKHTHTHRNTLHCWLGVSAESFPFCLDHAALEKEQVCAREEWVQKQAEKSWSWTDLSFPAFDFAPLLSRPRSWLPVSLAGKRFPQQTPESGAQQRGTHLQRALPGQRGHHDG